MKYLLVILLLLSYSSIGQIVPSSCNAPDSVIAKYKVDAKKLALGRIKQCNSSYVDSATIPAQQTDSILRSLIAVYNCSLKERDTVTNFYNIHTVWAWDILNLNDLIMLVDTAQDWVKDIKNSTIPTRNNTVNTLLSKYHFNKQTFRGGELTLTSDSDYNINAITSQWYNLPGVWMGFPPHGSNLSVGDGNYILVDSLTNDFILLTYVRGWGDCPSGCTCHRYWQFKVYQNCDVELYKVWQVAGPSCDLAVTKTNLKRAIVSPNPFTDFIRIDLNNRNGYYKIIAVDGRQVLFGKINSLLQIDARQLPKGLYTLIINTEDKVETLKIIKE